MIFSGVNGNDCFQKIHEYFIEWFTLVSITCTYLWCYITISISAIHPYLPYR